MSVESLRKNNFERRGYSHTPFLHLFRGRREGGLHGHENFASDEGAIFKSSNKKPSIFVQRLDNCHRPVPVSRLSADHNNASAGLPGSSPCPAAVPLLGNTTLLLAACSHIHEGEWCALRRSRVEVFDSRRHKVWRVSSTRTWRVLPRNKRKLLIRQVNRTVTGLVVRWKIQTALTLLIVP